ncbi:hydroxymethylglutaryl-lyase [Dactylonectria estremocensis]|uniref:hydroxymethylglutaryl-CoA lyase n=1 Tax=Dactylonectria estremocensis TaxID=1079267 RepID=A0A9P9ESL7_9HYPO|nr:hydroxymethylglutaryl-lyase [Dactylonectria estremocensis]
MHPNMSVRQSRFSMTRPWSTNSTFACHHGRHLSLSLKACRRYQSTYSNDGKLRIIEVAPRDGLQNLKQRVSKDTKVELIRRLAGTGLCDIEATSFVSPKWVPQLADGAVVMKDILRFAQHEHKGHPLRFPVLAPNFVGLKNATAAGAKEVVVFASITEAFSKSNQNCTVDEALSQARVVAKEALSLGIKVRGVVSCIFSDPFSGPTAPEQVLPVVQQFLDMGCYEVGLGDTLGVGTPKDTQALLKLLLRDIPASKLAGHFHDTYGMGIANIFQAYEMGIRTFDSSVAGLGGCPYAPGARGNVATEDIVYGLEQAGIDTGVNLDELISVGQWISQKLGIPYGSRAGAALAAKRAATVAVKNPKPAAPEAKQARSWTNEIDTGEYRVSRSETALRITLTRPKNGNSMTVAMLEGLTNLFRNLAKDSSVYHVVIEAEGKYFCTGMDLSGGTAIFKNSGESSYYGKVLSLFDAIDQTPQTTIALVDGPCYGGGVGLGFACDVRLASPKAAWTLSEVKIGVNPAIISKYLVREWGASMAREAMISGREVSPDELQRVGAVHSITEPGESLSSKLDSYLDQLEKGAPRAAAVNKELVRVGWYGPETKAQAGMIQRAYYQMMSPGLEGEHGIQQFQNKTKSFSWREFWGGRNPFEDVQGIRKQAAADRE